MEKIHFNNWMADIDSDEFTLLESRLARVVKRHNKLHEYRGHRDQDGNNRPRKRNRPQTYRER